MYMSTSKKKAQVRPDQSIRKINQLAVSLMGVSRRMGGLVPVLAAADRPAAANLPDGILVFNTDTSKLQITVSGSWVNVA